MAAAAARVGVATADLFPRLSLTGLFGQQSIQFTDLTRAASQFWSFGPAVRWPIFDAGRLRVQDAREEEALIQYETTVLSALEEVDNAVVAYDQEQQRQAALAAAVAANRQAAALAQELYSKGLRNLLEVLVAQRAVFAAEQQWLPSAVLFASQAVALYKALGAGGELLTTPPDRSIRVSAHVPRER